MPTHHQQLLSKCSQDALSSVYPALLPPSGSEDIVYICAVTAQVLDRILCTRTTGSSWCLKVLCLCLEKSGVIWFLCLRERSCNRNSQVPAQQPFLFLPSQERNLMLWVATNSFLKIAVKCICEKSVSVKLSTCSLDGDR